MDNPLTLQEAKDQVAKSWGLKDFNELKSQGRPPDNMVAFMESVAELYARSKWDEACEAQRKAIDEFTADIIMRRSDIYEAPKPEFKP